MEEKRHELEIVDILKGQIKFLKGEIMHKNTVINDLLCKIHSNKSRDNLSSNLSSTTSSTNDSLDDRNLDNDITVLRNTIHSDCDSVTEDPVNPNFLHWQPVGEHNPRRSSSYNKQTQKEPLDICTPNRYRSLVVDTHSDFEKEVENQNIKKITANNREKKSSNNNERQEVVVNQYPENDILNYSNTKTVPGNASYANMTRSGKKNRHII